MSEVVHLSIKFETEDDCKKAYEIISEEFPKFPFMAEIKGDSITGYDEDYNSFIICDNIANLIKSEVGTFELWADYESMSTGYRDSTHVKFKKHKNVDVKGSEECQECGKKLTKNSIYNYKSSEIGSIWLCAKCTKEMIVDDLANYLSEVLDIINDGDSDDITSNITEAFDGIVGEFSDLNDTEAVLEDCKLESLIKAVNRINDIDVVVEKQEFSK